MYLIIIQMYSSPKFNQNQKLSDRVNSKSLNFGMLWYYTRRSNQNEFLFAPTEIEFFISTWISRQAHKNNMSIYVIGVQFMRATCTPDFVIKLQAEENKYVVLLLFLFPFIITILFSFLDPRPWNHQTQVYPSLSPPPPPSSCLETATSTLF